MACAVLVLSILCVPTQDEWRDYWYADLHDREPEFQITETVRDPGYGPVHLGAWQTADDSWRAHWIWRPLPETRPSASGRMPHEAVYAPDPPVIARRRIRWAVAVGGQLLLLAIIGGLVAILARLRRRRQADSAPTAT